LYTFYHVHDLFHSTWSSFRVPLYFKKGAATRLIGIYEKEKTGYTITNLAPGKTYYVRVRSYKKVKVGKKTVKFNSEWSGTVKKTLK
jgi:nucleoside-triphosphatase THEP1